MGKLILPPNYIEIDSPVIFLAGPIQGAPDWQARAIEIIKKLGSGLYIASPRRGVEKKGEFTREMYNAQVDWETYHLRKAGENGTILFWLAKEENHLCRRAYAQTSRFEIAEWKIRHERDNSNIVIGIEEGFSGEKYIRRRFSQDCPEVSICSNLEETCKEAIRLIYRPN